MNASMRSTRTLAGFIALILVAPLLVVISAPLHTPAPQWSYVAGRLLPSHLWETGLLLTIAVCLAALFGISSPWLVSTFDFQLRRFFRWAMVLPLALPTYISAITFANLFGPTGSINRIVHVPFDIVTLPGLAVVFALVL